MKRSLKCAFYQWRISSALDCDGGRAKLPLRHMAGCGACREFHERSVALAASLRREAGAIDAALAAVLNRACAKSAAVAPERGRPRSWRLAWGVAVTAAAAAILVMVLVFAGKGRPGAPTVAEKPGNTVGTPVHQESTPSTQPSPEDAARALAAVSDPIGTLKRHARGPIDRQIDSLRADAEAAGRFLASCLPISVNPGKRDR